MTAEGGVRTDPGGATWDSHKKVDFFLLSLCAEELCNSDKFWPITFVGGGGLTSERSPPLQRKQKTKPLVPKYPSLLSEPCPKHPSLLLERCLKRNDVCWWCKYYHYSIHVFLGCPEKLKLKRLVFQMGLQNYECKNQNFLRN